MGGLLPLAIYHYMPNLRITNNNNNSDVDEDGIFFLLFSVSRTVALSISAISTL